jgi:hypothetical protein
LRVAFDVSLAARKAAAGQGYEVTIDGTDFSPVKDAELVEPDGGSFALVPDTMKPPGYPHDALMAGAMGRVLLALHIRRRRQRAGRSPWSVRCCTRPRPRSRSPAAAWARSSRSRCRPRAAGAMKVPPGKQASAKGYTALAPVVFSRSRRSTWTPTASGWAVKRLPNREIPWQHEGTEVNDGGPLDRPGRDGRRHRARAARARHARALTVETYEEPRHEASDFLAGARRAGAGDGGARPTAPKLLFVQTESRIEVGRGRGRSPRSRPRPRCRRRSRRCCRTNLRKAALRAAHEGRPRGVGRHLRHAGRLRGRSALDGRYQLRGQVPRQWSLDGKQVRPGLPAGPGAPRRAVEVDRRVRDRHRRPRQRDRHPSAAKAATAA